MRCSIEGKPSTDYSTRKERAGLHIKSLYVYDSGDKQTKHSAVWLCSTLQCSGYSWLRRWEVYDNDLAPEATVSSFICWTRHHLIAINQKAIYLGKTSESRDTRYFHGWSKTTAKSFDSHYPPNTDFQSTAQNFACSAQALATYVVHTRAKME